MAICAGSSFLVALFHQTHLQTIRSVNRENLIAWKCAIEASATPGLYHSSQLSHSWDSLRSSETGISFWAQRNLYIKGHTCSCCCCCCCCCFFFFFACWSRQQNFSYDNFLGQFALVLKPSELSPYRCHLLITFGRKCLFLLIPA